mmetsp:Transcript_9746/g.23341  ORF Transcript_9746/g.23341 Transcript_9746/m.23341 type:complete len:287 (+) Transcript_9746:531-1391(+)
MDAAISVSPKTRSKRGFSKTLLRKGISPNRAPKRSQEELCAWDTTSALSGSAACAAWAPAWEALRDASAPSAASLSAAFAAFAAASFSASAAAMASRDFFHCFVFSAFLSSSPRKLTAREDASITRENFSLVVCMKLEEAAEVESEAFFRASFAFRSASLSSAALSNREEIVLAVELAEFFQLLSTSEVFEERLFILPPNSSSLSEEAAPDCWIFSEDRCTFSQSFRSLSSASMSFLTWSMTCLMKLFLLACVAACGEKRLRRVSPRRASRACMVPTAPKAKPADN